MKLHAACRYTHAPIEALAAIQEAVDFGPEDVASIEVRTFDNGTMLDDSAPDTVLGAKFSTPVILALRLCTGRSDADVFTQDRIADETVRRLAERISIAPDDAFQQRATDGTWGASVSVELTDGRRFTETVEDARGGGKNPFTTAEIHAKFDSGV